MALTASTLYKVAGAENGIWLYTTTDAVATVTGSGYFNDVTDNLKLNDVIIIIDTDAPTIDLAHVTSATGAATVTTSAVEGVTVT